MSDHTVEFESQANALVQFRAIIIAQAGKHTSWQCLKLVVWLTLPHLTLERFFIWQQAKWHSCMAVRYRSRSRQPLAVPP